jgi:dimethylsulfide dehydrogenase subunit gamma/complex iron-sulfur molybdoenzyme family reductase subunit gamma
MNLRYFLKGSLTLALALLTTGVWAEHDELNPNIQEVKPGDTVKVSRIPGTIYLRSQNDPDDLIWDRLPTYRTNLFVAPPVHQSVNLRFKDGATRNKHLYFQVARSDQRFYIRMRWKDATEDLGTTVDDFRDGVAVQYALKEVDTSYMMGSGPDKPVNIWYWRADQPQVENLAAGGFGSTTTLEQQTVSGAGAYIKQHVAQDSEWHVVMSRPFKASDTYDVDFDRALVPMGFAVWQGSDKERDGNKRVTHTWIMLDTSLDNKPKK